MSWTVDTLKEHLEALRRHDRECHDRRDAAAAGSLARSESETTTRFSAIQSQLDAIRAGWHDRFVGLEKSLDARLAAQAKGIDELRRLVYIGLGVLITLQFLVPLLKP